MFGGESTHNLDPKNRRILIDMLKSFEHTKIIATHDLDMVLETCNRVYIFNHGRIKASGLVKDILLNKDLLEQNGLELPLCLQHNQIPDNLDLISENNN